MNLLHDGAQVRLAACAVDGQVSQFAGKLDTPGTDNGPAAFYTHFWGSETSGIVKGTYGMQYPWEVIADADGVLWLGDNANYRVMRRYGIDGTPKQVFGSGIKGDRRGTGTSAQIKSLRAMAVTENWVYFADESSRKIRRFHKSTLSSEPIWTSSTYPGTGVSGGRSALIRGLAVSPDRKTLFVSDSTNYQGVSLNRV